MSFQENNKAKKTFVVLYHPCRNIELIKDVGRIPYYLHRFYGYASRIVCYKNSESYDFLENEAKGVVVEHIKRIRLPFVHLSPVLYLLKNHKNIDVLNLYHLSIESVLLGYMYRLLNRRGILYIKTDLGVPEFEIYSSSDSRKKYFARLIEFVLKWILLEIFVRGLIGVSTIVSTETHRGLSMLHQRYSSSKEKIMYLPNGSDVTVAEADENGIVRNKKNIILTAGRIGAPEKNNEMFLRALTLIDLQDWEVVFLGKVEDGFHKKVAAITSDNFELQKKFHFPGFITGRNELFRYYAQSKVFCLTSNRESFGIVLVEALMAGNFIVSTRIPSGNDITDNEKHGRLVDFDDSKGLAAVLQNIIDKQIVVDGMVKDRMDYARSRFSWPVIISKLSEQFDYIQNQGKR